MSELAHYPSVSLGGVVGLVFVTAVALASGGYYAASYHRARWERPASKQEKDKDGFTRSLVRSEGELEWRGWLLALCILLILLATAFALIWALAR
jgi:hypothetical protein